MPKEHLVTQVAFVELTKMEAVDLFLLIEGGKMPVVKRGGAHFIDLNHPKARCYLPENRKQLF
jgi:hypothetical protein